MLYVRHVTANDGASAWWQYDHVRKVVFLSRRTDSCSVNVCSPRAPRFGAFPVARVDATSWRIFPVRYSERDARGELVSKAHPIADSFGSEFVHLLDAPDHVGVELAELG